MKGKTPIYKVHIDEDDEWEVKPEIMKQLQDWKMQTKTTALLLEASIESNSEDTASSHSGKETTRPAQEVEDTSNKEVQPASPSKKK